MKVFNVTDEPTAALQSQGLVNQHLKVGDTVIPKGGSAVIRGTARELSELQVLLKVGAVAIDELPETYAIKRGLDVLGQLLKPTPKEGATVMVNLPAEVPVVPDLVADLPKKRSSKKDD